MTIPEKAEQTFKNDFNCAQSVFSTFAPELGLEEKQANSIAQAFGGGINLRAEMCGAVSGALMVIGMRMGDFSPYKDLNKELTKKFSDDFIAEFQKRNKSVICKSILGKDLSILEQKEILNAEEAFDKICPLLVKSSAEILINILKDIEHEQQELL